MYVEYYVNVGSYCTYVHMVGCDQLLLSWIMQICDNICSSFFKLWLGPLDVKLISKPCVVAGQVVARGFE
jgi:hypothetical protein